jgi:hypothetical protein
MTPSIRLFVLILTWLFSAAMAGAAEVPRLAPGVPPETAPLRPFTAFCWTTPGVLRHVKSLYWITTETQPGVAANDTKRMDEGTRVLFAWDWTRAMLTHPEDNCRDADGKLTKTSGVWPVQGPTFIGDKFEDFLAAFKQAGGKIDFLVLDREETRTCWVLNKQWLETIAADPRAPALIQKLGFSDLQLALFDNSKHGEYLAWNALTERIINDATDFALLRPLRRQFPSAGMSNYGGVAMSKQDVVPDINGHLQYTMGDPPGTHQSPSLYGETKMSTIKADWSRPFMQVVYSANLVRCGLRNNNHRMLPWFGYKSWREDLGHTVAWGGTPYWEEGLYQSLLSGGTSNVLFFNPPSKAPAAATQSSEGAVIRDNDDMEAAMTELEEAAKKSPIVSPLTVEPIAWDADVVVSAAKLADGATLARVTFSENATKATFSINGKEMTVERPQGKTGAWVRMP